MSDERHLAELFGQFAAAPSIEEAKRILESHPELLSDECDAVLEKMLEHMHRRGLHLGWFMRKRALLLRSREVRIEQAAAEIEAAPDIAVISKEAWDHKLAYEKNGDLAELDLAVAGYRELLLQPAVVSAPASMRVGILSDTGEMLLMRFRATRAAGDIDGAVALFEQAISSSPPTLGELPSFRKHLADALRARYELTGDPEDLERAGTLQSPFEAAKVGDAVRLGDDPWRLAGSFAKELARLGPRAVFADIDNLLGSARAALRLERERMSAAVPAGLRVCAHELALFAQLAYLENGGDSVVRFVADGRTPPGRVGAEPEVLFLPVPWHPATSQFNTEYWGETGLGFVASTDKGVVVAIRGTKDLTDFLVQFEWGSTPYGTHLGYESVAASIEARIRSAVRNADAGRKVYVTGHSLGGAVATIVGRALAHDFPDVVEIFTFGSPPMLTKGTVLDRVALHRFIAPADVVPEFLEGLHAHAGTEYLLGDDGSLYQLDGSRAAEMLRLVELVSAVRPLVPRANQFYLRVILLRVLQAIADPADPFTSPFLHFKPRMLVPGKVVGAQHAIARYVELLARRREA